MRRKFAVFIAVLALVTIRPPVAVADTGSNGPPTSGSDALIQVGSTGFSGESQTSDTVNGWGDDQWQFTVTQAETVSVTVTDEYIVGDNYAVYIDGSTIGTTPPEPLYGPTYSEGTFTASVQAGTHLITVQDIGGIQYYDQGYTFMIPAGYSVSISFVSAPKPVMFVHGWNASYRSSDWTPFVDYLTAQLRETTNLMLIPLLQQATRCRVRQRPPAKLRPLDS